MQSALTSDVSVILIIEIIHVKNVISSTKLER